MKTCIDCARELDVQAFALRRELKSGFLPYCRQCGAKRRRLARERRKGTARPERVGA